MFLFIGVLKIPPLSYILRSIIIIKTRGGRLLGFSILYLRAVIDVDR